ncbi:unnamed protein product [Cuscuta epithymum]|uniref:Uncharacterized protein n=1 Tax=Cuscuta epithymum TaxID=186058 RepID=A0AAV0FRX4_9ASTE|nr:unnamed protein product [Cuscuta epithymum]
MQFTKDLVQTVLRIPTHAQYDEFPTNNQIYTDIIRMGYIAPLPLISNFKRQHVPRPWRTLIYLQSSTNVSPRNTLVLTGATSTSSHLGVDRFQANRTGPGPDQYCLYPARPGKPVPVPGLGLARGGNRFRFRVQKKANRPGRSGPSSGLFLCFFWVWAGFTWAGCFRGVWRDGDGDGDGG